ncbi:aldehyde dehydrogenase family protein [Porifericola rhodea]|uniref:aldehyde dehydrogenase family protein n=1 Tax=Porifericola rhodea TaxID=930972 RepID=UPI0026670F5D|nr:aldehyde dehydrogenase family protein [Porifericola rhodea]WKN30167.1 aldehyde dehydrogenase family protein [Porifericola rhodea]
MNTYQNLHLAYIGAEWRKGSADGTTPIMNPWDNSQIAEVQNCSADDIDTAYQAAAKAQKKWAETSPSHKRSVLLKAADIMEARKEEIIDWLVRESGSTQLKAGLEWSNAFEITRESATFPSRSHGYIFPSDIPNKENRIYRKPLGVVGIISPWNFPYHLSMRSFAPALATGNGIVLKPASDTIVTGGTLIAKIFEEAGVPQGLISVVMGKSSEIGDAMVAHPIPELISFTGSTKVGKHIGELAGKSLKKTSLELGGNNVMIVLDDADVDYAVESATMGKFMHQGQVCIALNRILLADSIYDQFAEKFADKVRNLPVGNPEDKKTVIGPIINQSQVDSIQEDLQKSIEAGAKKIVGGKVDKLLMEPVVLTEVTNDMPIAANEIFGPVAPLIRFSNVDEAVEMANNSPYGLSGAVHSKDIEHAVEVGKRIKTGMVHINDQSINDEYMVAFGGEKASGIGRFGGEFVLEEFTTLQWVSVQKIHRNYPV